MKGPIDALGFDMAVMTVAVLAKKEAKEKEEKPPTEDPIMFFNRMGHRGWNETKIMN